MYHRFNESKYPSTNIQMDVFKEHINLIRDSKFDFLNPKNIKKEFNIPKKQKQILITIDDGFKSFYENAWPYLKKNKIPFIIFVSTEPVGKNGYMTWDQIKEIEKEDFVLIGHHSHTHDYLIDKTIEEFIKLIDDPEHVVKESKYYLSEIQAKAILELRLQRLTGMERDKLSLETEEIANKITEYLEILSSREVLLNILKSELLSTKEKMDGVRRTFISDHAIDADDEDLIQQEEMVVTVSHRGYIKRVPLDSYRAQRRGGKGKAGMKTRDEDFVTRLFIANTHTPILFFTSAGIVHQLKCYKLPVTSPTSMGKAMINLLPISTDENIQTIMPMPNETEKWDSLSVVFATSSGSVRRNKLSDFTNIRSNGKIAMKLGPTDRLIGVAPCNDESDIMLASNKGKAIRFATKDLRVFNSRDSMGVRGIKLKENDYVVSLSVLTDDVREFILAVTENGFGKRSKSSEYRRTGRGGQGIANIEISKKNGNVITSFPVLEGEQLMLATDHGKIIRISVDGGEGNTIRVAGRKTQGVNLFTLGDGEKVVSVDRVKEDDEDTEEDSTE